MRLITLGGKRICAYIDDARLIESEVLAPTTASTFECSITKLPSYERADPGSASGGTFQCMQFLPFFISVFLTCSIRPSFTSRSPNKDQKTEKNSSSALSLSIVAVNL